MGEDKDLILPSYITKINQWAFRDCDNLTSVYYQGTESDWNNILFKKDNGLSGIKKYYYSEEEPTENGDYWHYDNNEIVIWE